LYYLRGNPADQIKIKKKIPIDGKETGIDRLDRILRDVAGLGLTSDEIITDELVKRAGQFSYISSKNMIPPSPPAGIPVVRPR